MKHLLIIVFLCFSLNVSSETKEAFSGEMGWVTRDGYKIPNSDAIKSLNGFGGYLIVTPDSNWQEKWNTSVETVPYFSESSNVSYGDKLTILTFYINPKRTKNNEIRIFCDIKVTRPDGSISVDEKNFKCAVGKIMGDLKNVRLTSAILNYVGDKSDPPGEWVVEVTLKDKLRNIEIPLKTHFYLGDDKK